MCCFTTSAVLLAEDPPPAAPSKKPPATKATPLFTGKNLEGWKTVKAFSFEKHGKVTVEKGELRLGAGEPATGIARTGKVLRMNYEIALEAKRTAGSDFFCGLTFPVNDSYLSLIIGGWGGGVTGLSNLDDMSAVENETTGYTEFKNNQWYKIRLRVTPTKVEAWLGDEQIVDVETKDRKMDIWWEQEPLRPLGIATWRSAAALRNITVTALPKK